MIADSLWASSSRWWNTFAAAPTRPIAAAPVRRAIRVCGRVLAGLVTVAAALSLGACSSSRTGRLAIAMDPAGRLLAVVALCDAQKLRSIMLTDETTGTITTVRPKDSPPFGGTVILTAPIANPRPEGVFDLLDRGHDYTVGGSTRAESDEETGTFPAVRFKLDDVVKDRKLRTDSVLAVNEDGDGTTVTAKDTFLSLTRAACD